MKFEKSDINKNKYYAALSYVWILFLIPLLMRKKSPYAQYNGKQGLILFLFETVLLFIWIIPYLGFFILLIGWIYAIILSGLGIIKTVQEEEWEMPLLGRFVKWIEV